MSIDADPFEQVRELSEQLALQSQRYLDLCLRLETLSGATHQLAQQMAVICEAYLAGDHALVLATVKPMAMHYQKNTRCAVIH